MIIKLFRPSIVSLNGINSTLRFAKAKAKQAKFVPKPTHEPVEEDKATQFRN
jgi:CRISPR/Cas system CMR-associated protein Cmr5 small subunit